MTVDEMINIHVGWKIRLIDYFRHPDGSLKSEKIADDTACPMGKQLAEMTDPNVRITPTFQKLVAFHRSFHQEAANILRRAEQGEQVRDEVSLGADSEYSRISKEIVSLLLEMKKETPMEFIDRPSHISSIRP